MKNALILCRSVTSAQRCARILEGALIRCSVVKAPRELTGSGCAYALLTHGKLEQAVSLLRKKDMPVGRIFEQEANGTYREVRL